MNPKERERVAYHEVGHALAAASVPTADPIHKVSIILRIVEETEGRAKEILTKRDSDPKAISERLLEKEVLEGDELRLHLRVGMVVGEQSSAR